MPDELLPPEQWHTKWHGPWPIDACWRCGRSRAVCRQKIPLWTVVEADAWVQDLNETRAYTPPVVRYRCRWCRYWHMKKARTRTELARAEKQRRKWLIRLRGERHGGTA